MSSNDNIVSDSEYKQTVEEEINRYRQNIAELDHLIFRAEYRLEELDPLDSERKVWQYGLTQRKTRLAAYKNMLSALEELL